MRVLLLEDDVPLGRKMASHLRGSGLSVDLVESLADAINHVNEHDYDCLVLDRLVPGGDALDLVAKLRNAGNPVPVIVVSGNLASSTARVDALRGGADDCLAKPFALEELSFRVHSLCRRAEKAVSPVLHVGDLTLDTTARKARRDQKDLSLHAKELAILTLLVTKAGQVVTRQELWEHCWGEHDEPYTNTLDVHICKLRDALGKPNLIRTHRGVGYSLDGGDAEADQGNGG